ncbi:DNA polymerase III subunit beta [Rhizomonospora bruguierae]|uniref:DNA polymerase III subunit beta n=1 Tax=Rhizomonospora bruguierae TaxID=1581705 RepID=UPI001BD16B0A|nr:DNA polymerase III subunit beta [Micromonospora sp. NBRC 107566]
MQLDLTVAGGALAEAAARISRLLPARTLQPALAAVLVTADPAAGEVVLAGSDGEQSAAVRVPAAVHGAGAVAVSRRGLAETLAGLDSPEVRLVAEGSRLAVRLPGARFALPRLEEAALPPPAGPPPVVGTVEGGALRAAVVPVASAASREHALPIFTAVRVRSGQGALRVVATDRFRMAAAALPWRPAAGGAGVDTLLPAALFAEVARQVGRAGEVTVHADADRFGLAWDGGHAVTSSLGTPFPDQQIDRLLSVRPECAVEVAAGDLAGAVDRAAPYAGPHGRIALHVGDGAIVVRGSDPLAGESEEAVKASVRGDHVTRAYQARYLLDALRPFAGRTVRVEVQAGLLATLLCAAGEDEVALRYLVVPMRTEDAR